MSNLVVLKEHIRLLRQLVNSPEIEIKSFTGLISALEKVRDTSLGDNAKRKQSLEKLNISEENYHTLLSQHEILCSSSKEDPVHAHRTNIFQTQCFLAKGIQEFRTKEIQRLVDLVHGAAKEYSETHVWCRSERQAKKKAALRQLDEQGAEIIASLRTNKPLENILLGLRVMSNLIHSPEVMQRTTLARLLCFFFGCFMNATSSTYQLLSKELPKGETVSASWVKNLELDLKGAEAVLEKAISHPGCVHRKLI